MKKSNTLGRWLWWFSLIAASILLYKTSDNLSDVFSGIGSFISIFTPFIIAFFITFVLYAPCNRLELFLKRKCRPGMARFARPVSILVAYVVFLAVITGILVLLLPALYTAIASFIKSLPTYYADLSEKLQSMTASGGLLDRLHLSENLKRGYDGLYQTLLSLANTENIVTVFKGALSVTSTLLNVLMALIISIYMLAQRESLLRAVKSVFGTFLKDRQIAFCTHYAHKTAAIFYNYLYGALIDASVVAVLMCIGLTLFGLPRSLLLGCFIGLMNFIPYFGAIIAGCLVVLIALLTKNIYTAIGVAVYILAIQQLDGNIIQPKIVGQTVGVRPIYVLLAITVGGGLFGFWGILLSVPLMAVVIMLVHDFIDYRNRKKTESPKIDTDTE